MTFSLNKKSIMIRQLLFGLFLVTFAATANAAVDFQKEILPIFEANCVKCHKADKAMGKLKLDSVAGIEEKLASDAHLLTKGEPDKSELYERLVLPADDKKRMPKGADPLDQKSIDLIAAWIKEGAMLPTAAVAVAETPEIEVIPMPTDKPEAPPAKPTLEALPLPEVPAASQEAVDKLMTAGAQVLPLYADSNLLDVSFALSAQPPSDDTLALLEPVAEQVHSLNLKNAKISEAGWSALAKLKNLNHLDLHGSSFSDSAATNLAGLPRLESLNLYETVVTDGVLEPLKTLPRLSKLYLWKTNVTLAAATALGKEKPMLEWNLGWDHPEIAKARLENQKVEFTELSKKADDDVAKLKIDLEVAEKAAATAKTRLKDVEDSLAKLEGETDKAVEQPSNAAKDK
jgi:mono/diheme cytochrome c family protein